MQDVNKSNGNGNSTFWNWKDIGKNAIGSVVAGLVMVFVGKGVEWIFPKTK